MNATERPPSPVRATLTPCRRAWNQLLLVFGNEIRIFSLLFVVFVFFLSFVHGRTQGARVVAHAQALLHERRNTIDTGHWNTVDKVYCRGHYYTSSAPGMGYLAVAPLAVFEALYSVVPKSLAHDLDEQIRAQLQRTCADMIEAGNLSFDPDVNRVELFKFHAAIWFLELVMAGFMAAAAVVFYRVLLLFAVPKGLAWQSALALGLGTVMFFYARTPYAMAPIVLLLLLAFYLLVRVEKDPTAAPRVQGLRLAAAGLALGLAVALEYIQIIGAALMFLYAWRKIGTRRVWLMAAGGLPAGLLIMLYHQAAFGGPFTFPYKYAIPFLAVDGRQQLLEMSHPTLGHLFALAFGPSRGLFIFNPVLLLLAVLFVKEGLLAKRHLAESWLALGILASYLIFQASYPAARVTAGAGPRYAGATVPFLMLGVIFVRSRRQLKAFYVMAGISVLANWFIVQRDLDPQHYLLPLAANAYLFLRCGPSSSLLEVAKAYGGFHDELATWVVGLAAYLPLAILLAVLWQETKPSPQPLRSGTDHPSE